MAQASKSHRRINGRIATVVALACLLVLGSGAIPGLLHGAVAQSSTVCSAVSDVTPAGRASATPVADAPVDLLIIDRLMAHQAAANVLASLALDRATDDDVRRTALRIAESQFGELQLLRTWRQTWYPGANPTFEPSGSTIQQSLESICAETNDFDGRFLELMLERLDAVMTVAMDATEHATHRELGDFAARLLEARARDRSIIAELLARHSARSAG